jgi:hypothetical protein
MLLNSKKVKIDGLGTFYATIVGTFLGLLMGYSEKVMRCLSPIINSVRQVPIMAWVPLAIIWFGLGEGPTLYMIFMSAVFPLIINTIAGVSGIDFNPISSEQLQQAEAALGNTQVYWTKFGKVYHTHDDCGSLNQSDVLTQGTVKEAVAANRTRLCFYCAKRDNIQNVATDNGNQTLAEAENGDTAEPETVNDTDTDAEE